MNQVKEEFLSRFRSDEMFELVQLIQKAEERGLAIEVTYSALMNMKEFPESSPLLCMQIALNDWDI